MPNERMGEPDARKLNEFHQSPTGNIALTNCSSNNKLNHRPNQQTLSYSNIITMAKPTQGGQNNSRIKPSPSVAIILATFLAILISDSYSSKFISEKKINHDTRFSVFAEAAAQFSPLLYLPSSSPSLLLHSPLQSPQLSKRDLPTQLGKIQPSSVCQVKDGESVAIVEIEESRASDMSQQTSPIELPILGSVSKGEIELRIESETHKYFQIWDKKLKLTRPLDRDAILKENSTQLAQQPISSIYLQVSCLDKRPSSDQIPGGNRKVIIPILVKVLDHNDNAPKFTLPSYTIQVNELTPVGTVLIDSIQAIDLDSANNGLVEYSLSNPLLAQRVQPIAKEPIAPRSVPKQQATTTTTTTVASTTSATTTATSPSTLSSSVAADLMISPVTSSISVSSPSDDEDKNEKTTTATSTSITTRAPTRSSKEPSFNLNNEPIVNGPMEEPDESESDEALLAALNATDSIPENDSPDMLVLMDSPLGSRRRKRRGTSLEPLLTTRRLQLPAATTTQAPQEVQTTTKSAARTQLWTNLMSNGQLMDEMMVAESRQTDSSDFFSLELGPNSNKPVIKLRKPLDYESQRVHTITIWATDRATNLKDRLVSSATLTVKVLDGDDQGPAFVLDQTGCATGSFQHSTTSESPFTATSSALEPTTNAKLRKRSVSFDGPTLSPPHLLHRGFKMTDENFDFSDTLVAGEESDESGSSGSDEMTTSIIPSQLMQTHRHHQQLSMRKFQNLAVTYQAMSSTSSPASPRSTTKARYIDYTCLSPNSVASGSNGQAEYYSSVMSGESDYLLRIAPQAIKARDRDELNAPIRYSFINGTPSNYSQHFQINPLDASIKQIAPIERHQAGEYTIWVQAQEQTSNKFSSVAKLTIEVIPTDKNPPIVMPNSYSAFVDENSPVGASVYITPDTSPVARGNFSNLLRISVIDGDSTTGNNNNRQLSSSRQPARNDQRLYEFETTSDAFKVNREGFVYVNKASLDRDAPNQAVHVFQVTARQVGLASSRSISSPISLNVTLLDLNDNPPILANSTLLAGAQLTAGSGDRGARFVTKIRAFDRDLPENSRMFFAIKHVSNNGKDRFRIHEDSGDIEALGKFVAGELFSLTVQVSDDLGRFSQGILEVSIIPGPNTSGPQFVMLQDNGRDSNGLPAPTGNSLVRGYSVEVSEGIAVHSAVFQVNAVDPENDPISYSILDGNVNNDFSINSKTGIIYVANRLDREEVSAYSLLIQARDSGGLSSVQSVHISVTDNNDENPTFSQGQYSFSVEEGVSGGKLLGRVVANDRDSNENGMISYQLSAADSPTVPKTPEGRPIFACDENTGDITLLEPLDYEQTKSHALIVTARDHGENPRSSTASVLIRVVDVQDEAPYFERYFYELRLAESSQPNQRVVQVQARDPDSISQITYTLRSGDSSLFAVDPQTGLISTIRPLDYEEATKHTLLIGTVEQSQTAAIDLLAASISSAIAQGETLERSPICRVDVSVADINDNAPEFPQQPLPVRCQDSAQLGTIVTRVLARDLDQSEPNNQTRYQLVETDVDLGAIGGPVTSNQCAQLFMVDASSGAISVKSDLKRDSASECNLIIRVRDLGQPSLSSTTSLTIFIDHIAEISPNTMIGFADSSVTVELAENSPANTLVKTLPIINKPKSNFPLSCEIVSGNELAKFYMVENEQRDCELRTRDQMIDYELKQRYSLTLKLNTIGSGARTVAHVQVNIMDRNDNKPIFQQPARYSHLTQNKFLAAIATDSPSDTQVIQLRASDLDSAHSNGLVSYEILNDNELEARFKVDPIDGIVRTSRPVEDIPSTRLPLRLKVMARDNPESPNDALETIAEVVVNLIDDRHRMALVLKDTPTGRALDNKEELLGAIQERTGFIPGLEKAESLKIPRNGSLESDVSGTDFWFYLIEPGTFRIVSSDEPRVRVTLLDSRSQSSLLDIIGQNLGFTKAKVRLPYSISLRSSSDRSGSILPSRALGAPDRLAPTLIGFALFIAIASAIVVLYQCGAWSNEVQSRSSNEKLFLAQQQQQQQQQQQHNRMHHQQYGFAMPPGLTGLRAGKGNQQSLISNPQDFANLRTAFSTLQPIQMHQHQQQTANNNNCHQGNSIIGLNATDNLNGQFRIIDSSSQAAFNKEYETQMLKMSVLFDDNNSVDDQNLNDHMMISQNLNGM